MPYDWLHSPLSPAAPAELVDDVSKMVAEREYNNALAQALGLDPGELVKRLDGGAVLADIAASLGRDPAEVNNLSEEIRRQPRLAARVELSTGSHIAGLAGAAEGGLRLWAIGAAESGLHRYHDEEFGSVEEMFQAALADIPRTSTTWSDLNFLANTLYPFAKTYGIQGVERIWQDGTIANARAAVPLLRGVAKTDNPTPEELAAAQKVVSDVLNLTTEQFLMHNRNRTSVLPLEAWDYKEKEGGVLVVPYSTEAQRLTLERRLKGNLDVHFGVGAEPVLDQLAATRASWIKGNGQ